MTTRITARVAFATTTHLRETLRIDRGVSTAGVRHCDSSRVDRAAWISTFEEALAKAIVQIVLSRQAEQASQAVGSPKE